MFTTSNFIEHELHIQSKYYSHHVYTFNSTTYHLAALTWAAEGHLPTACMPQALAM